MHCLDLNTVSGRELQAGRVLQLDGRWCSPNNASVYLLSLSGVLLGQDVYVIKAGKNITIFLDALDDPQTQRLGKFASLL